MLPLPQLHFLSCLLVGIYRDKQRLEHTVIERCHQALNSVILRKQMS